MNDIDIFNTVTASIGGRFPLEIIPDQIKKVYDEVAERANDLINVARKHVPNLPPIYFDFIHNSSINAVAFKAAGRYFIGINTGTIFMLRSVIGRILSDARMFRRIGNPDKELNDLEPLLDYSVNADDLAKKMPIMTPRDPIRTSYAWFLQDQAIMFLVGHEIAHITRGHVDYLANKKNIITKEVDENLVGDNKEIIQRQAIEIDADGRSIISRIDSLRITFEDAEIGPPPWAGNTKSAGQIIQDWAVSVNIIFNLFGSNRFTFSELKGTNHPPLLLRQAMCNAKSATEIVQIWDKRLESVVMNSLNGARDETNEAFRILLGHTLVPASETIKVNFKDHALQLLDEWNSHMRFEMKGFSYEF